MKKLTTVLLIDDNPADNRYHKILIEEMNITDKIYIAENGVEALNFLKDKNNPIPELIFLDIGMPKMDGWEFLKEYKKLEVAKKSKIIVVILTTAKNPNVINSAPEIDEITNFELKPLTKRVVTEILKKNFKM